MELKTALLTIGCVGLLLFGIPIRIDKVENEENFKLFLQKFNKTYIDNVLEKKYEAFTDSLSTITTLNKLRNKNSSAFYGLTKFSDLSKEEFLENHLQRDLHHRISTHHLRSSLKYRHKRDIVELPLKVDWRQKGVITDINNQKLCGACWAFCTVETIEAMNAIQTNKLEKLSVQEAIDCAKNNNQGCDGGDMCSLLDWMVTNKINLQTNKEYPLELITNQCKLNNSIKGIQVSKYLCESLIDNEGILLTLLANHGPVAVAINAITWQNYLGGVIQYHCDSARNLMNHAVQIVGYDKTAEIPHYIVRNSWGPDFGDNGYLYLAIGNNLCGLANEVAAIWI